MQQNPASIKKSSRYHQGRYELANPKKYIGDPNKVLYRSSWERKLCYKFDHSKEIIAWGCESIIIPYISPIDGLPHRYFTDFITIATNSLGENVVTIVEVKPEKEKYPPTSKGKKKTRFLKECKTYEINQAKWKYARAYCKKRGWNFIILSEKQILGK